MHRTLILLISVAGIAAGQFHDIEGRNGARNQGVSVRAVRYQKLTNKHQTSSPLPVTPLGISRARRPPISFRSRTNEDTVVPVTPARQVKPILPALPPLPQHVKPVTEESEEEIIDEPQFVEKKEEPFRQIIEERPRQIAEERSRQEERRIKFKAQEEDSIVEDESIEDNSPQHQFTQAQVLPAINRHLINQLPIPQPTPIQYHRAFPVPITGNSKTVVQHKPAKARKPINEEPIKQVIKPPTKPYKPSGAYDARGKKPVAQIIKRYRNDNPDGSITWGFENDDGSYKEEIIGIDCITRGKYGYIDPDGLRREYTYETGIKCDEEEREEEAEGGFVDYQENKLVLPGGRTIDLSSMSKKQARRPRPF